MKTTVQIPDALLADVRKIASKRNTTIKSLIDEGLRLVIAKEQDNTKPFKLKDCSVSGVGLHPEMREMSFGEIIALSYGDRGGRNL